MKNSPDDISTSGRVEPSEYRVSECFTEHSDLPSNGYCRLCRAQRYGQWFVLKSLKVEYASDPYYQGMLDKEFQLMMQLKHPNIVRVHGMEEDAVAGHAIVMEFVDGRTLQEFLKERPNDKVRRTVAKQMLEAISYFHKKQIIHRDLKPSNILVTHNGNHVKIIDFGFSDSDSFVVLKEPAYTKAYASPEQLAGDSLDCRTDLYAFGLILKQLFPKRYVSVVRKCTQPRREMRFDSAEEIVAAMAAADKRRTILPWVTAALCILLLLLASMLLWLPSRQPSEKIVVQQAKDTLYMVPSNQKDDGFGVEEISSGIPNPIEISQSSEYLSDGETASIPDRKKGEEDAKQVYEWACTQFKSDMDTLYRPLDSYKKSKNANSTSYHTLLQIVDKKAKTRVYQIRNQMREMWNGETSSFAAYYESQFYYHSNKMVDETTQLYRSEVNLPKLMSFGGRVSKEEYERLQREYSSYSAELSVWRKKLYDIQHGH